MILPRIARAQAISQQSDKSFANGFFFRVCFGCEMRKRRPFGGNEGMRRWGDEGWESREGMRFADTVESTPFFDCLKYPIRQVDNNANAAIWYWHKLSTWDLSLPIIMLCAKITSLNPNARFPSKLSKLSRRCTPYTYTHTYTKEYQKANLSQTARTTQNSIVKCKQSSKLCTIEWKDSRDSYTCTMKPWTKGGAAKCSSVQAKQQNWMRRIWLYAKATHSVNNLKVHVLQYHTCALRYWPMCYMPVLLSCNWH